MEPVVTVPKASPRYAALDGYRFLAASAVILFHFDPKFHLGLAAHLPAVQRLYVFVDFFFMLSGFVIAIGYRDRVTTWRGYGHFLRARFARLYPLHVATLAAFVALALIGMALHLEANHPAMMSLSNLPANLLMVQGWGVLDHLSFNGPSWSISAEWFVYLCVPLFFALAARLPLVVNALLAALFVAVMAAVRDRLGMLPWMGASYDFGMLRAVPTFFVGVLLAVAFARWTPKRLPSWWTAHAVFVLVLVLLGIDLPDEAVLPVFALLIVTAALAERSGAPSLLSGWLFATLGQASYAVYMLPSVMSVPVLLVLRRLHLVDTPWSAVSAALLYGAVVLAAIASFRWFETPARRWLMGIRVPRLDGSRPGRRLSTAP